MIIDKIIDKKKTNLFLKIKQVSIYNFALSIFDGVPKSVKNSLIGKVDILCFQNCLCKVYPYYFF